MSRYRRDPIAAANLHRAYMRGWTDGAEGCRSQFDATAGMAFVAAYERGHEAGVEARTRAANFATALYA